MTVLLRHLEIDLDRLARELLVSPRWSFADEVVLEVYRWLVVTGSESGRRWRARDRWEHKRFPGFADVIAPDRDRSERDQDLSLADPYRWHEQAATAIARAVLGRHKSLELWRAAQGSMRRQVLDVRVRRSKIKRSVHLDAVLKFPRGRRLTVQFNKFHADAVLIHRVLLIPGADGWALGIAYGCTEDRVPAGAGRPASAASEWLAAAWKAAPGNAADPYLALPHQHDDEPTSAFIERCGEYLRSITTGPTQ